jgi:hypothetical protein
VGNEGIVGVPLVPGGSLAVRAISSVAGWVLQMGASTFLYAVERDGTLRALVDDYLQALFGQIAQAAACNRLHSHEERLCRWLLTSHGRVGADEFAITHEFLGHMLRFPQGHRHLVRRDPRGRGSHPIPPRPGHHRRSRRARIDRSRMLTQPGARVEARTVRTGRAIASWN